MLQKCVIRPDYYLFSMKQVPSDIVMSYNFGRVGVVDVFPFLYWSIIKVT